MREARWPGGRRASFALAKTDDRDEFVSLGIPVSPVVNRLRIAPVSWCGYLVAVVNRAPARSFKPQGFDQACRLAPHREVLMFGAGRRAVCLKPPSWLG